MQCEQTTEATVEVRWDDYGCSLALNVACNDRNEQEESVGFLGKLIL